MAITGTVEVTLTKNWTRVAADAGVIQMWPKNPGSYLRVAFGADASTAPAGTIVGDTYQNGEKFNATMVDGEHLYVCGAGKVEMNAENAI